MDVELLVIPDCPHAEPMRRLVSDALAELELAEVHPRVTVVTDPAIQGFAGSPTVLIDGTDPFSPALPVSGLACRVYPGGQAGLPSLPSVLAALAAAR